MVVRAETIISAAIAASLAGGCDCDGGAHELPASVELGGRRTSRDTLRRGKFTYMRRCRSCHGREGRGGPRAARAGVRPRDLTLGVYKYTGVLGDALPQDEFFRRIVTRGVAGSIMNGQQLPHEEVGPLIAYVKYLAPRWRKEEPGASIPIPDDPWGAERRSQAIERGRRLYLGRTDCWRCHPAYAGAAEIQRIRDGLASPSERPLRSGLEEPTETPSRFGRPIIEATDFRTDALGGGRRPQDLYRAIAAGIGGTRMEGLHGQLPARDIWALAHHVRSLVQSD